MFRDIKENPERRIEKNFPVLQQMNEKLEQDFEEAFKIIEQNSKDMWDLYCNED